ncbi:rhodanese-like domain-containing protein [Maridesulfovibrio sp. FT414]|uniref:rhodanese-like domain-containing protein n=1 Tax=Maridesulfovibrio sp. FT414 TaxID=2979469 RepID=UPI003D8032D2
MLFGKKSAILFKFVFISALSVGLAIGFNMVRPHKYSFTELSFQIQKQTVQISTEKLLSAYDSGEVQLVDARSDSDFTMGHIPGAVNIPSWAVHDEFASLSVVLAKDKGVIVYCDGLSCGKSTIVAKKLLDAGYGNVMVYSDGIDGWISSGRDLEVN